MSDKSEVYVDCLVAVALHDGVVRMDFGEYKLPAEGDADGSTRKLPDAVSKHRLFMSMPGFVRSMGVMQEVMKRLEEEGRKRREGGGDGARRTSSKPFVAEALPAQGPSEKD